MIVSSPIMHTHLHIYQNFTLNMTNEFEMTLYVYFSGRALACLGVLIAQVVAGFRDAIIDLYFCHARQVDGTRTQHTCCNYLGAVSKNPTIPGRDLNPGPRGLEHAL